MNMANSHNDEPDFEYRDEQALDYRANFGRRPASSKTPKSRRAQYGRTGNAPTSHNGIHRRRNKRFSW